MSDGDAYDISHVSHHVHQKQDDPDKHPCLQSEMIACWLFKTEAMAERTNSERVTTIDYIRQGQTTMQDKYNAEANAMSTTGMELAEHC